MVLWIVHGFNNGPNQQPDKWSENLSQSYIQRFKNKTVIVGIVDWSVGSRNHFVNYGKSAVNTLVIGRYLALLSNKIYLPTKRVPRASLVTSLTPSTSTGKSSCVQFWHNSKGQLMLRMECWYLQISQKANQILDRFLPYLEAPFIWQANSELKNMKAIKKGCFSVSVKHW